jgi:endoglycosylceramidase
LILSATFLLLLVVAPTASAVSAPSSSGSDLQWLHVDGHFIVREDNARMILRGANVPPLASSSTPLARYGAFIDVAKSMGYNVIRLPVLWAQLEPSPGMFIRTYLDSIKKIVDLAGEKNMYVVVDMHQFKMDGFPQWVLPKTKSSDEASAGFWRSFASQQELVKAWKALAAVLKDRNAVAGYDLLNEPYGGTMTWQDFAPILNEFYSVLIPEIQNVDAKHIIFFEPTEGVCILGQHIALRPSGMNLAFSPHFYVSGPTDYLNNVANQVYNLAVRAWNIPLWIGEFGGSRVDVGNSDSLHSLGVLLDLFDRYCLGWAFWVLSESNAGPRLVDGNGKGSTSLTELMTRIFPASYTVDDLTFVYSSTRFQLNASADAGGHIEVSVPTNTQSMVSRFVNCVSTDGDQHSMTIDINSGETAYFYLDSPESISQLEKLAESEFEKALQISDELNVTVFDSSAGREYVKETQDVVNSMQRNLASKHYEFVLGNLDRVGQLRTLALQEENDYVRTEVFVNSVRQDMLGSQGYLTKQQLVLLAQAYESLDQGNYTSAVESARQVTNLTREPAPPATDLMAGVLSTTSSALLGMVVVLTILHVYRRRKSMND